MFKCKKCGSGNFKLQPKGTATGLYCADCGFWHKWVSKDELYRYRGLQQAKELTTAEKLLWLVENTNSYVGKTLDPEGVRYSWIGGNGAFYNVVKKPRDNDETMINQYFTTWEEAINAAYEWVQAEKAKESNNG